MLKLALKRKLSGQMHEYSLYWGNDPESIYRGKPPCLATNHFTIRDRPRVSSQMERKLVRNSFSREDNLVCVCKLVTDLSHLDWSMHLLNLTSDQSLLFSDLLAQSLSQEPCCKCLVSAAEYLTRAAKPQFIFQWEFSLVTALTKQGTLERNPANRVAC